MCDQHASQFELDRIRALAETLRAKEELLQVALDAAEVGTWIYFFADGSWHMDERSQVMYRMPARMLFPDKQTFQGIMHPDDEAEMWRRVDLAADPLSNGLYQMQYRIIQTDGSVRWIAAWGRVEFTDDSPTRKPVRMVGASRDITIQKRGEDSLRQANANLEQTVRQRTAELEFRAAQLQKLAGELTQAEQKERRRLAQVLHDHLQQLLVGAKMRLSMMESRLGPASHELANSVSSLLDEAIAESRSLTVQLAPPVLYDAGLPSALAWLARWMYEQHGLKVDLRVDENADPHQENQRVMLFLAARELLFNAVKHSGQLEVLMTLRCVEGNLWLLIEDHGCGFKTSLPEHANPASGGFGLFSLRERLDLLGGRLTITSSPGQGTRASVRLPLRTVRGFATGSPAPIPAVDLLASCTRRRPATNASIRVLLADDHRIVRESLAGMLTLSPNIELVGQAANGQEAVNLALNLQPEVVVMDINMPLMNGVEATRLIRRQTPTVQVIGLSMHTSGDMAQAMKQAGAFAYLSKDGPIDELVQNIVNAANLMDSTSVPSGSLP